MLARLLSGEFLTFVPLDREASKDSIRDDLGMLFCAKQVSPVLTWGP